MSSVNSDNIATYKFIIDSVIVEDRKIALKAKRSFTCTAALIGSVFSQTSSLDVVVAVEDPSNAIGEGPLSIIVISSVSDRPMLIGSVTSKKMSVIEGTNIKSCVIEDIYLSSMRAFVNDTVLRTPPILRNIKPLIIGKDQKLHIIVMYQKLIVCKKTFVIRVVR